MRDRSPPTTRHMSHVACHVSHVICHVSRITCPMSHVFFFYGQTGEAYRWRVCYQRGLPRLVHKAEGWGVHRQKLKTTKKCFLCP